MAKVRRQPSGDEGAVSKSPKKKQIKLRTVADLIAALESDKAIGGIVEHLPKGCDSHHNCPAGKIRVHFKAVKPESMLADHYFYWVSVTFVGASDGLKVNQCAVLGTRWPEFPKLRGDETVQVVPRGGCEEAGRKVEEHMSGTVGCGGVVGGIAANIQDRLNHLQDDENTRRLKRRLTRWETRVRQKIK